MPIVNLKIDGRLYEVRCVPLIDLYPRNEAGDCAFCNGDITSGCNAWIYFARTPLADKCPVCSPHKKSETRSASSDPINHDFDKLLTD